MYGVFQAWNISCMGASGRHLGVSGRRPGGIWKAPEGPKEDKSREFSKKNENYKTINNNN